MVAAAEEAEHSCLQNVVGPLPFLSLVNRNHISLWLASSSSPSFSITVRLPDSIPSGTLYTSLPGLSNALPTKASTAPKSTVREEKNTIEAAPSGWLGYWRRDYRTGAGVIAFPTTFTGLHCACELTAKWEGGAAPAGAVSLGYGLRNGAILWLHTNHTSLKKILQREQWDCGGIFHAERARATFK